MKTNKSIVLLAISLLLPAIVYAATIKIKNTPFMMDVPQGWEVDESGWMGSLLLLRDSPKDNFRANILVYREEVGDMSEEEYRQASIENLQLLINDAKILRKEEIKINNLKFVVLETTGTQGKLKLHWLQAYTIYEGVSYIFSGTTLEQNAGEYIPIFENTFKTIRIEKNKSVE